MKDIIDAFDCPLKPIFTPSKKADAGTQYKIDHSPVIFRTVKQRKMSVNSKPVRKKSRNQSKRDRIKSMLEEKTRYLNVKYMTKNKMNLRGKNKPSNNKKGSKVKTNLDLKLSSPSIETKEFGTVRFLNVKIKKNTKKSSDNAINQKSNHFTNNIPLKMNPSESGIHASLLSIQNQNSNFKADHKELNKRRNYNKMIGKDSNSTSQINLPDFPSRRPRSNFSLNRKLCNTNKESQNKFIIQTPKLIGPSTASNKLSMKKSHSKQISKLKKRKSSKILNKNRRYSTSSSIIIVPKNHV